MGIGATRIKPLKVVQSSMFLCASKLMRAVTSLRPVSVKKVTMATGSWQLSEMFIMITPNLKFLPAFFHHIMDKDFISELFV